MNVWSLKNAFFLKQDWRVVDSPKKWTNEFVLFAFLLFTANKSNSFVRFFGECTASQSCSWFYLTFISEIIFVKKWYRGHNHIINVSLHCAMTDSCSLGSNSSPNPRSFCSNSRFGTASPTTTRESIWPFPLGHFPAESSRQNCSLARAIIMTYFQEGSGLFSAPNDGGMLQQVSKRINATWRRQCGD